MLVSTKHVPLTDGYRRNLRHEGHNLNVMLGALTVFATCNFADNYAPLMFQLVRHNGSAEQPENGEVVGASNVGAEQPDDAPRMPTLKNMRKLVGQSPRADLAALEPFESQQRGFSHGHWKKYSEEVA